MYKKYGDAEVTWLKDRVAKADPNRTLYPERYARYQKSFLNRRTRRNGKLSAQQPTISLSLEGDCFLLITKKLGAKGFATIDKVKEYMLGNGITGAKLYSINPININVDIRIDGEGESTKK
ncbi:MAG: hypothetical protein WC208_14040 [Gallionella sp.]|jgi:hypothetical protein